MPRFLLTLATSVILTAGAVGLPTTIVPFQERGKQPVKKAGPPALYHTETTFVLLIATFQTTWRASNLESTLLVPRA